METVGQNAEKIKDAGNKGYAIMIPSTEAAKTKCSRVFEAVTQSKQQVFFK